ELLAAFQAGTLTGDFVAVIRGQGPRANGMPELHKLTPTLQVLQDRGQRVALLTDGRMSGASGTVLAAIHVIPEAAEAGPIGRIADGDTVTIDAEQGEISVPDAVLNRQSAFTAGIDHDQHGCGREMFGNMRRWVDNAERGACTLFIQAQPETVPLEHV
ncbi:MAG: dihydroxy-acid dehydratase, partial [Wenzhouxiangella sp.]